MPNERLALLRTRYLRLHAKVELRALAAKFRCSRDSLGLSLCQAEVSFA